MLSVSPFGRHGLTEDWPERDFINPDITVGNMVTANQIGSSRKKPTTVQQILTFKSKHLRVQTILESILIKKKKVALRYSLTFTGKAKESHYNPRTARAVLGLLHIHTSFKHGARNSLLHQIMRRGSCQISPSRSDSGLITNLEDVIMRVKQKTSSGCAECI